MTTTNLLESISTITRAAAMALLFAVSACGPGSGGTGTGPSPGGGVSSLEGAVFATAPDVPPALAGGIRMASGSIELVAGCRRFHYVGEWQLDDQGFIVVPATLLTSPDASTETAQLQLGFSGPVLAAQSVHASLVSASGAVLFDAELIFAGDAFPASTGACP